MAVEITVPRLGWSMEEGIFGEWLKKPGDFVAAGEPLFSLETDKVTMDVESFDQGILHLLDQPQPGDTVGVGQLLGYLLAPGEAAPPSAPPAAPIVRERTASVSEGATTPSSQPNEIDRHKIIASPRARALAKQQGIDLAQVRPRPGKQRIISTDLPTSKQRTAIAHRLEESFRAPHFYIHADADAETLAAFRESNRPVTYNDMLVKAISLALTRHRDVNAYWANGIVNRRGTHHVALAAQIDDTLLTPVLQDPASKGLPDIAAERQALLERCRRKEARPADFENASATLTNLGAYGVDRFQAILNPPQSVIVAAGALKKRPTVVDDMVVARLTLPISLSVDHRVIDGIAAAAFLRTLVELIESPTTMGHGS